ncbi:MAG TPA: FAD-binding oxidoreductase, partial [Pyrinomonadaceae bacterium]|nr:FAD-binding oxidoreductase [Pyrinomonadaceae bacterium]
AGGAAATPPAPARLPESAEVVVVGGGVMGVATAFWLARLGADVLLVESRRLAWGASGRNGGFMLGGHASLDLARTVLREEGIEADYDEPGHLALASSPATLDEMRGEVAARPPTAAEVRVIERGACEELLGRPLDARFLGGRWMPRAATIHPARFVYGLAAAAARRGAVIAQETAVLSVERARRGDAAAVETRRGRIRARHVVVACNAETGRLLPPLRRVLTPARGQVLASRPLPSLFRVGLAVDWGTVYWRQAADGVIVLGGYRNLDRPAETTAREALNPRIQAALARFLPESFPGLPAVAVGRRWAGIMDVTPDEMPVVGAWPEGSGTWVIAGFGGHGLPPALGAGRALAEAIVRGTRAAELDRFDPARFAKALG